MLHLLTCLYFTSRAIHNPAWNGFTEHVFVHSSGCHGPPFTGCALFNLHMYLIMKRQMTLDGFNFVKTKQRYEIHIYIYYVYIYIYILNSICDRILENSSKSHIFI